MARAAAQADRSERARPAMAGAITSRRTGESRRTLALFLLFAGFYLLTASGHFYATDEETLFRVTESLVERRTFALPEGAWGLAAAPGRDGRLYAVTGPGQSILATPLYLLGRAIAPLFPAAARGYVTRFWVALFGALVTAATVALLYRLGRLLGYGGGAAFGLAAIYGLATTAWPHGRTFFAEPLAAFLLLLACYGIRRGAAEPPAPGWLVAAGAAMVGSLAVKPQAVIALPVLGLYLVGHTAAPALGGVRLHLDGRRVVRLGLPWVGGLALIATPFALFNAVIFGGPLRTGYGAATADIFTTPFLTGLYGLILSSGKGLLWYSPPVLLALAGGWPFLRRHRAEALVCLGIVLAHLAFYSRVLFWHGDGSWGPRYLMIALPFIMLPAIALLDGLRAARPRLGIVTAVITLGVAVQLLGVLVNFDWYLLRSDEHARHFSPPATPILAHARLLGARAREWHARAIPPRDTALLTGGFAPAEPAAAGTVRDAAGHPLFPRWTTGAGAITLHPAGQEPILVKLTFFDHRPPALRGDHASVLVDDVPLTEGAIERRDLTGAGEGWVYQFTVPASTSGGERTIVTLRSASWNPKRAGMSDRDEELGLFVHNVEAWQAGRSLAVREALPLDPMPATPRQRFWWFNDDRAYGDTRHHLTDLWVWYAMVAGFPRRLATGWIASYALVAGTMLVTGLVVALRSLPAGTRRGAASHRHGAGSRRRGSGETRGAVIE